MKRYVVTTKRQLSTLALGCALIALTALALVNCTDPAPATYTVKFDTNGGEPAIKDNTVEAGKLLAKPATEPAKEGYSFAGWYKDKALTQAFNFSTDKITANTTLYAKWIATYTVTFNMNGGEPAVEDNTVEAGKLLAKPSPDPTKPGYSFAGWYNDQALTQAFNFNVDKITANTTLYAQWIATYTVTFNTNGGEPAVEDKTVEAGKLLTRPKPDPAKTGYSFAGWYNDEALTQAVDFSTEKITQNITLYAQWIATYTVTFNLNGGTPNEEDKTVAHGERVEQPQPNPTKADSLFVGWYKDAGFAQAFNFSSDTITQDITLYVKWKSNLVDIPDAHFRARLQALIPTAFVGEKLDVTSDEVAGLKQLNLNTLDTDSIKDLTGIQYFTALTQLDCSGNQLAGLDVSNNTALTVLYCSDNQLGSLDVSNNTTLTQLYCNGNQLGSLDVSTNTALTQLYCNGNQLAGLDVSNNTALTVLSCSDNQLGSLDVSNNTALTRLDCSDNQLGSLDVSNNTALIDLFCDNNQLTKLDVRGVRIGKYLIVYGSTSESKVIETLKVHVNLKDDDAIKKLKAARGNEVTIATYSAADGSTEYALLCSDYDPTTNREADRCSDEIKYRVAFNSHGGSLVDSTSVYHEGLISKPANPTKVDSVFAGWYSDEALTQAFDFSSDTITANITLYAKWRVSTLVTIPDAHFRAKLKARIPNAFVGEMLDTISDDITELTTLNIPFSGIRDLTGIHYFTALTELQCYNNQLTDLDVSKNTQLRRLNCEQNQLNSLAMSGNTQLTDLNCSDNSIASLDVSKNTQLRTLNCFSNRLDSLDVSKNTQLRTLNCFNNRLDSLDVSKNTQLRTLNCEQNQLDSLAVSGNTALTELYCGSNRLGSLDVSKNTTLTQLDCSANQLDSLAMSSNTVLKTLKCGGNQLGSLDVSKNTTLTQLYCSNNRLGSLDVSNNIVLKTLKCSGNQLTHLDTRGMRKSQLMLGGAMSIQEAIGETNTIDTLKVHESIQDHAQINAVKVARSDKVTIKTYSAPFASVIYIEECSDYDPTADDGTGGKGVCNDAP